MRSYTDEFLSHGFQSEFQERELAAEILENRMKNLEKRMKKQIAKDKQNLQRWFK